MRGKLISFEGTDCSGKSTQTNLLIKKLKSLGESVVVLDFPNYSTPTGKIVRRYLDNEFGDANSIDSRLASIFYAEDRFASKPIIEKALKENDFVILDRYVESSMGHQGGKIKDSEKRKEFFKWIYDLEYENFSMPKPDLTILLFMPYEVSCELLKTRVRKSEFHPGKEKLDGHEGNPEHLKNACESYLHLSEIYGFLKIDCAHKKNLESLKSHQEIHKEVWSSIKELLREDLETN